jgi:hypothetical protein
MQCAHVQARADDSGWGALCGQETELVCWHCHAPRCINHALRINGEVLCLAAVREKGLAHGGHALAERTT